MDDSTGQTFLGSMSEYTAVRDHPYITSAHFGTFLTYPQCQHKCSTQRRNVHFLNPPNQSIAWRNIWMVYLLHASSTYRVSHLEVFFNWLWQIERCKLKFVWRWFWHSEIMEFEFQKPVFKEILASTASDRKSSKIHYDFS